MKILRKEARELLQFAIGHGPMRVSDYVEASQVTRKAVNSCLLRLIDLGHMTRKRDGVEYVYTVVDMDSATQAATAVTAREASHARAVAVEQARAEKKTERPVKHGIFYRVPSVFHAGLTCSA